MTMTIETKIAKNGTASVYVNGKRVNRKNAVKFAEENGLPIYKAIRYTYGGSAINEYFATALSAYKWAIQQDCESNEVIRFTGKFENVTTIYESTPNDEEINADDEPEFATFIYAKIGEVHIKDRYEDMIQFFNQLVEDGLTEEQAEQVITVYAGNPNGLDHCKLIKEFKAQNAAKIDDYVVSTEAQDAAVDAEIKQTANTPDDNGKFRVTAHNFDRTFSADHIVNGLENAIAELKEIETKLGDTLAESKIERQLHGYDNVVIYTNKPEIENSDCRELIIGDERITFENGHSGNVSSAKYGASFTYVGERRGYFKIKFPENKDAILVTEQQFFNVMVERGACTIDTPEPPKPETELDTAIDALGAEEEALTHQIEKLSAVFDEKFSKLERYDEEIYERSCDGHTKTMLAPLEAERDRLVLEVGKITEEITALIEKRNPIQEKLADLICQQIKLDSRVKMIGCEEFAGTFTSNEDIAAHLEAGAPEGWTIQPGTKKLCVKYHEQPVADVEQVTERDLIAPESFFRQFEPLIDETKTPAQMFLDDRYRELAELEEMRNLPANTPESIKTIDEMIDRLKRDIAETEFAESDTIESFCKSGALDDDGNVWF